MRILHVAHEMPPHETAGVGVYSFNLARAHALHHEVFVFARVQDPTSRPYRVRTERRDGVTIRFVNGPDVGWRPFERSYVDARIARIFRRVLRDIRPSIVHFHHVLGLGIDLLRIPRAFGIPTVVSLHDFWMMCPKGQRMSYADLQLCETIDFARCGPCVYGSDWTRVEALEAEAANGGIRGPLPRRFVPAVRHLYAERFSRTAGLTGRRPLAMAWAFMKTIAIRCRPEPAHRPPNGPFELRFERFQKQLAAADLLVAPSLFLRDEFIRLFHLPPGRVLHSSYGMALPSKQAPSKTPSRRLRFGYVGSIIVTKGLDVAVDGFLQAAATCPDIELHVFGVPNRWSEPYAAGVRAKASSSPFGDRIVFHGRFDNSRIAEIHSGIDVLIVPSIWFENAPLVLYEAAMSGTGVLTSDRGGMLEFVKLNEYGRTFELGNPASLADAIQDVARNPARLRSVLGEPPVIKPIQVEADAFAEIYGALRSGA